LPGRVSPSSSCCPRADPVEPTTTPPDLLRSFRRSVPIRRPVRSSASPRQPTWRHRATANSNAGTVRSRARSSGTRPHATSRRPAASSATPLRLGVGRIRRPRNDQSVKIGLKCTMPSAVASRSLPTRKAAKATPAVVKPMATSRPRSQPPVRMAWCRR